MKIILLLALSFFAQSCASAPWVAEAVPFEDEPWRICTEEYDGPELHLKGLCYNQDYTKNRTWPLSNLRKTEKEVCLFEDKECLIRFPAAGKKMK